MKTKHSHLHSRSGYKNKRNGKSEMKNSSIDGYGMEWNAVVVNVTYIILHKCDEFTDHARDCIALRHL